MAKSGEAHVDPICGRKVAGDAGARSMEYKRHRYFFCSDGCKLAFEKRAERYRLNELARMGSLLSPGRVRWGLA